MGNYIEGPFIYALLLRESCAWCLFCYRLVLLLLLEDICYSLVWVLVSICSKVHCVDSKLLVSAKYRRQGAHMRRGQNHVDVFYGWLLLMHWWNKIIDKWQGIRAEVCVVNYPAGQPVSQRRSKRWQHLQLQHTTQLLIYAEHLSLIK